MIKKGCLFGFVVLCLLPVLTGCPNKVEPKNEDPKEFFAEKDFASLSETGFVPPVVRLAETYVNDKLESKDKTLSFEYYYKRSEFGSESYDEAKKDFFTPGNNFHTATIKESDAGDASKTKLKYDKLKAVNGGELYIGTRFVLGLIVKDQYGKELHRSMGMFYVTAPKADVKVLSDKKVSIPGDHSLAKIQDGAKFVSVDKGRTIYVVTATGETQLDFGNITGGKTCSFIVK